MANTLHEDGCRGLRAKGPKGKDVEALVRDWVRRGLSDGTMKNRMAHLRWWAPRVGKPERRRAERGLRDRQAQPRLRRREAPGGSGTS